MKKNKTKGRFMEKVDTIAQLIALRAGLSELADDADKLNKYQNDLDNLNRTYEDDCLELNRNIREEKELAQEIEDIERHKYHIGIDYCDKRAFSVNVWIRYRDSLRKPYKPYLHLFDDNAFVFPPAIIIAVIGCVVSFFIAFFSLGENVAVWLPWVVKVGSFVVVSLIGLIILVIKNTIAYKHNLRRYNILQKRYDEDIKKIDSYIKDGVYLKELKDAYTSMQENTVALQKKIEKEKDNIDNKEQQTSTLHQSIVERYDKLSTYYSPLLHQSDFDKIDYIIYLFDTNRCDTMREALMQLDAQKRTDSLISAIGTAVQYINNNMNRTMRELGQTIQTSLSDLAISVNQSISSNNDMLTSRVYQLESSLNNNLNKSCQQLVDSINKVSTNVDVSVYLDKKRID